jgi:hypothetical protein
MSSHLNPSSSHFNIQASNNFATNKLSSLSTSVHSIPSSSKKMNDKHNVGKCTNTNNNKPTMYSSKSNFIYEKLNQQRLELVDMLLKHGADKYLVGKLSYQNVKKMNKKSLGLLKKWYVPFVEDESTFIQGLRQKTQRFHFTLIHLIIK